MAGRWSPCCEIHSIRGLINMLPSCCNLESQEIHCSKTPSARPAETPGLIPAHLPRFPKDHTTELLVMFPVCSLANTLTLNNSATRGFIDLRRKKNRTNLKVPVPMERLCQMTYREPAEQGAHTLGSPLPHCLELDHDPLGLEQRLSSCSPQDHFSYLSTPGCLAISRPCQPMPTTGQRKLAH